jgi:hypothetical protein
MPPLKLQDTRGRHIPLQARHQQCTPRTSPSTQPSNNHCLLNRAMSSHPPSAAGRYHPQQRHRPPPRRRPQSTTPSTRAPAP